ncbi:MAG: hypothetical protein M3256_24460 [Actinomycetota bacterium]|nr:hypothetical protein [Actinomycetota bacterium]
MLSLTRSLATPPPRGPTRLPLALGAEGLLALVAVVADEGSIVLSAAAVPIAIALFRRPQRGVLVALFLAAALAGSVCTCDPE